jgi:hypothetical protein
MRRALHPGRAGTWGTWLVGVYGASLIAAGAFVADPALGFPPGTPAGPPDTISLHGILHFAAGGVGFLSLIAGCFVFARRFAGFGERGWAAFSAASCAANGVDLREPLKPTWPPVWKAAINIAFGIAVVLVFGWLSAVSARLAGRQ